ncbi:DUF434 domain-containing protein [Marinilabilia rubra]|uniref:DUF434 domain-containing protein n=1 Tax=Marinilabilia rubra TaxID=2162893 RepID=A0A2U2B6D3_9BACT|nr:DUF434 domain-containing protein [Marinilabilia rubra]PWD98594.1 DUF434 domain-containing protein [Marinilabilia rubra]
MSPDQRKHRGPDPNDAGLFAPDQIQLLRRAAYDYCLLLDKTYTPKATLKLVGDHFKLKERQRKALDRCCQPQSLINEMQQREIREPALLKGQPLFIDGFNLLIILEGALGGAPVFKGRDGLIRDISGLHGSYRKISETPEAIALVASFVKEFSAGPVLWVFDKPVSNSGRLAQLVMQIGKENQVNWNTELCDQADSRIANSEHIVASSDSQILARCTRWFNLCGYIMENYIKKKWFIELF